MKTRLQLVAAIAALTLATPAAAQQAAAQEGRSKFGLGVAIVPLTQDPTIEIYAPIQITPQLRIEPSLGIFTNDEPASAGDVDTSDVTIGVGVFFLNRVAAPVDVYVGGRLKLNRASVDTPVGDDSGMDLTLAAAVGGEYYLVPKFSLGLEGELGLYQNSDVSGDDSGFFTTGLAFLRVYF